MEDQKEKGFFPSSPLLKTAGIGEGLTKLYPSGKDFPSKSEQEKLHLGDKNKKLARRAANSPQRSRESFWEGLSRAGDLGKASRKAKRTSEF